MSRPPKHDRPKSHDRPKRDRPKRTTGPERARARARRPIVRRRRSEPRRPHRQGDGARRPVLAPRCRGLDRRRPGRRQREADRVAGGQRHGARPHHHRRQADAAARAHAAVPLQQAGRPRDHQCRSAGPAHGVRRPAGGPAAAHERRPPRHRHRGAAAAHERRRSRQGAGAARHPVAAALPRARPWPHQPARARPPARRHLHRRA